VKPLRLYQISCYSPLVRCVLFCTPQAVRACPWCSSFATSDSKSDGMVSPSSTMISVLPATTAI
jgi:hypothetical protein